LDSERVEIREVGPRDGLQSERPLTPAIRAALCRRLVDAGLRHIEAASFVSPKAVPSMAGANELFGSLPLLPEVTWWVLVPNRKGAELARSAGATHLTVTVSASTAYSEKNVGVPTGAAIAGLVTITEAADDAELDVVVSCAFGSPFADVLSAGHVGSVLTAVLEKTPSARLTLADTTGMATPRRVRDVLERVPASARKQLGLHLHDSRGTALANALAAYELGVRRFDTAVGGLGGSPFAPGAGGNLATEDLVMVLEDGGIDTGVDLDALLAVARQMANLVGHDVPGRTAAAGSLGIFRA